MRWRIEARAAIALKEIEAFNPDVVVTLDDNAFRTVALAIAHKDIPVVFSGLNRRPESYLTDPPWIKTRNEPGGQITGVIEKILFGNHRILFIDINPAQTRRLARFWCGAHGNLDIPVAVGVLAHETLDRVFAPLQLGSLRMRIAFHGGNDPPRPGLV